MPEWLKGAASKAVRSETASGVRIPLSPIFKESGVIYCAGKKETSQEKSSEETSKEESEEKERQLSNNETNEQE